MSTSSGYKEIKAQTEAVLGVSFDDKRLELRALSWRQLFFRRAMDESDRCEIEVQCQMRASLFERYNIVNSGNTYDFCNAGFTMLICDQAKDISDVSQGDGAESAVGILRYSPFVSLAGTPFAYRDERENKNGNVLGRLVLQRETIYELGRRLCTLSPSKFSIIVTVNAPAEPHPFSLLCKHGYVGGDSTYYWNDADANPLMIKEGYVIGTNDNFSAVEHAEDTPAAKKPVAHDILGEIRTELVVFRQNMRKWSGVAILSLVALILALLHDGLRIP